MATTEITPSPQPSWRRLLGLEPVFSTPPARSRADALIAASTRMTGKKISRGQATQEAWQQEAIELYSEVGELRYVANVQANAASRANLFVGRFVPGQEWPEPVEEGELPAEVFQAFGGGPLGRAELIRRLFVQMFVAGDGYLLGLPPWILDDGDYIDPALLRVSDLSWHVMSTNEVQITKGELTIDLGMGKPKKCMTEHAVVVRVWRPNPFRWWQADSPVRANLPILREIVGLTKHVSASIDSRLAGAGILLMGDSFSLLAGQSPDPDDAAQADPIMGALMDAMLTAIKDRDAASAVMPIILQGPDEAIDKVRHLTFSTPFDSSTKDLRDEAIRRLALGLDTPPEVLLGLGQSTHWNAWIIEDQSVKTHIDPNLALVCDALTRDYLWPVLESLNVQNFRDYAVWWDSTSLTQRADRSKEAVELFDRRQLSGEALRRETGFDESDAPLVDVALEMVLDLVRTTPSLLQQYSLTALLEEIRSVIPTSGEVEGVDVESVQEAVEVDAAGPPETLTEPETP